jgi:hypothetical protein
MGIVHAIPSHHTISRCNTPQQIVAGIKVVARRLLVTLARVVGATMDDEALPSPQL